MRDLELAEDLAQEALVAALERWPESGIPDNPGAWLMATARNRALDQLRHDRMRAGKHDALVAETGDGVTRPDPEAALDDAVGDDLLRLMLIACHPVLSAEARVALTLRLLGGLTTEEIARAYLKPVPTVAQRLVRAKRTLAAAHVPLEVPRGAELTARLPSVLETVYLVFNEGYAATRGDDWIRADLCEDALRLGRILAALVPDDAEVPALRRYHLLPAVRGDLLEKLGRPDEARAAFEAAAAMTGNGRERTLLMARAARLPRRSRSR